jgi:hypothetical protein
LLHVVDAGVTHTILCFSSKLGGFNDHAKVECAGQEGRCQDCDVISSPVLLEYRMMAGLIVLGMVEEIQYMLPIVGDAGS